VPAFYPFPEIVPYVVAHIYEEEGEDEEEKDIDDSKVDGKDEIDGCYPCQHP